MDYPLPIKHFLEMILLQIRGVINIILLNVQCVRCQDYEPELVSILVDGPTIEIISGKSSIFKNT